MWRTAATELGATATRLTPVLLEIRLGKARTYVAYRMTTPLTDRVGYELAGDKLLAYSLLTASGIPVPHHVPAPLGDPSAARTLLRQEGAPLLAKPRRGSGGVGIVGQIQTPTQLGQALRCAWTVDSSALVERHRDGDTLRLLFLDGELLDVLRRTAPRVTGDGRSTIGELMLAENAIRRAGGGDVVGLKPLPLDLDCMNTLESACRRLTSVPAAGESVAVRSAANFGARAERARFAVCQDVVETARDSAAVLGVRLAGVDVLTVDPARPLAETGGVVLEVNPLPGLLHHDVASGDAVPVRPAVAVLARLLDAG